MSYSIGILVASVVHLHYLGHLFVPFLVGEGLPERGEVVLHLGVSHINAGHL